MADIKYPNKYFLGTNITNPRIYFSKLKEIIDRVNDLTDGSISTTDLTLSGDLVVGDDAAITGDLTVTAVLTANGTLDVNGTKIILDADADTSITADTDDQIDIEVAGADDFRITANTFTALSGSTIATNTIAETTAASGVTIDGALVKDSTIALGDGTVSDLSVKIGADTNNGIYGISDTQLGFAVEGTLVGGANTTGLFTDVLSEQTSTVGVTIDGALIKDGSFIGKQATATATAAGLTTGALTGADQFVTVTSASANDVICLPLNSTVPVGTVVRGWVGANGFELRLNATDSGAGVITINNVAGAVEAAIPATSLFRVEKVSGDIWILTAVDELGAVITAIIPDAA